MDNCNGKCTSCEKYKKVTTKINEFSEKEKEIFSDVKGNITTVIMSETEMGDGHLIGKIKQECKDLSTLIFTKTKEEIEAKLQGYEGISTQENRKKIRELIKKEI